jgi:putative endonuclease
MRFFVARFARLVARGTNFPVLVAPILSNCRSYVVHGWRIARRQLSRWFDGPGYAATRLDVGAWGEWWAARELRRKGYRVLFRRWNDGLGELDLIAWRRGRLIFVEVKSRRASMQAERSKHTRHPSTPPLDSPPRSCSDSGPTLAEVHNRLAIEAGEAVDRKKQGRISRAALRFKKKHRLLACPTRFDVIVVVATDPRRPIIRHWEGAFDAVEDLGSMY